MILLDSICKNIADHLPEGIAIFNKDGGIELWNTWMELKSGIPKSQATGRTLEDLFPELKNSRIAICISQAINQRQSSFLSHTINKIMMPLYEYDPVNKTKTEIFQNIIITPIELENSALLNVRDETSNVKKERLLRTRANEEKLLSQRLQKEIETRYQAEKRVLLSAAVIENTTEGVVITDKNSVIQSINPAFTIITGFSEENSIGKKISILKSGKHKKNYYEKLWGKLGKEGKWRGEFINQKPDGTLFTVESSITSIRNEKDEVEYFVNVFRDITDRKKNEALLETLSRTDSLTGLYNRRVFDEELDQKWRSCMRNNHTIAIALIDVDFFKLYNDHYGHQAGDECLQRISNVMQNILKRAGDLLARYGGEEFISIIPETDSEHVLVIIDRIRQEIENLKIPHEKSIHKIVTVSIGIAQVIPSVGMMSKSLISASDKALYEAKASGRNKVVVSDFPLASDIL